MKDFKKIAGSDCRFEYLHLNLNSELVSKNDHLLPKDSESFSDKRKAEFISGRICAQRALGSLIKESVDEVGIGKNREPVWPKGVVGSISHSKNWACAIVSEKLRGVGIDIEALIDGERLERLKERFITENEVNRFKVDTLVGTIIFSGKESFYKALFPHVKTFFGFMDAEVTSISDNTFSIKLTRNDGLFENYQQTFLGNYLEVDGSVITLVKIPF